MKQFLYNQSPNFTLWISFVFAAGILLYFTLPFEPSIPFSWLFTGLLVIISAGVIYKRHIINILYFAPIIMILLFSLGFIYSYSYSHSISTIVIEHDIREHKITGTVSQIDYTDTKARVYLQDVSVGKYKKLNVRLSLNSEIQTPKIGSTISGTATLFKPESADTYAGFDFAEWMYFKKLSATGFFHDTPVVISENKSTNINILRNKIHDSVAKNGNPTATGLSDSLVLGFTNAIDKETNNYAKASGIAHVFSISGFHITIVGGWLIAFFFLIFRSIPSITRNFPARYPAVICAWLCLLFYLELSGCAVATQRAFIMTSFMFIAFLFNRNIFSLRNVCLCFGLLLLADPHYLMEVGFQLSFAAIFGLVYFFGDRPYKKRNLWQKSLMVLYVIILTDLICTLFTGPLVAYHFHYFPTYSLLGNLLCLPIFSFIIMPFIMLGVASASFGWFWPIDIATRAYEFTIGITKWIYELPFSQIHIPQIPGYALAIIIGGFLCLMFLITSRKMTRFYLLGIFCIVSVILVLINPRPIFYASRDHELVAFMTDAGTLQFNKKSAYNHKFTFESWEQMNYETPSFSEERKSIGKGFVGNDYSVKCEDKVCIYKTPNWSLVYIQQFVPLYKNIGNVCASDVNFFVTYFKIDTPKCGPDILNNGLVIYENGKIKYTPHTRIWH